MASPSRKHRYRRLRVPDRSLRRSNSTVPRLHEIEHPRFFPSIVHLRFQQLQGLSPSACRCQASHTLRPHGFSPSRRLSPKSSCKFVAPCFQSWGSPRFWFLCRRTTFSHLPRNATTLRRIPLASSLTVSPRPLPSCRYNRQTPSLQHLKVSHTSLSASPSHPVIFPRYQHDPTDKPRSALPVLGMILIHIFRS